MAFNFFRRKKDSETSTEIEAHETSEDTTELEELEQLEEETESEVEDQAAEEASGEPVDGSENPHESEVVEPAGSQSPAAEVAEAPEEEQLPNEVAKPVAVVTKGGKRVKAKVVPVVKTATETPVESIAEVKPEPTTAPVAEAKPKPEPVVEAKPEPKAKPVWPPVKELLPRLKPGRVTSGRDEAKAFEEVIEQVFKKFEVKASVAKVTAGSRVHTFDIALGRGAKLESVQKLLGELRLATASDWIRVANPSKAKHSISLLLPRQVPDIVSLGDVLRESDESKHPDSLLIGIGRSVDGKPVVADLDAVNHLLVAGSPGGGVSSYLDAMLCSILLRNSPDQVRLLMIGTDSKALAPYRDVPHLAVPYLHDANFAVGALGWALAEMKSRYSLFERHRVTDFGSYNHGVETGNIHFAPLPRLVVILEDLAALAAITDAPLEALLIRLAKRGPGAGIHVVVATESPTSQVVTPLLKSNLLNQLAFATSTTLESMAILDRADAENLVGEGDGLLSLSGQRQMVRLQSSLVDSDEVNAIIEAAVTGIDLIELQAQLAVIPPSEFQSLNESIEPMEELSKGLPSLSDETPETGKSTISIEDGLPPIQEMPEWSEPDWRNELDLIKKRVEPCDLTGQMVIVSRRRLLARRVDAALLTVRLRIAKRFADRAAYRFKDRIDEDNLLTEALEDVSRWRAGQSNSVAWMLIEAAKEQYDKAEAQRDAAIQNVLKNRKFRNRNAESVYKKFAARITWTPLIVLYTFSVLALTFNRFEWMFRHLPLFNEGLWGLFFICVGIGSWVWVRALWRVSTEMARVQKAAVKFRSEYQRQSDTISHATKEMARLEQQLPYLEPLLKVLATGYRAPWHSSIQSSPQVTTEIDASRLPACVNLARAVEGDGEKMRQLKQLSLQRLLEPGWRTRSLEKIGELHVQSQIASPGRLTLSALDSDLGQSTASARTQLMEAFSNQEVLTKLGQERLRATIEAVHRQVLRNVNADLRPPVISTRENGYEKLSLNTSWLDEEDSTEDWLEFLEEILGEASPFGVFSIQDKRSALSRGKVHSMAVVPSYFDVTKFKVENCKNAPEVQLAPIDVVVRVDVSDWSQAESFKVFAKGEQASFDDYTNQAEDFGGPIG